MQSTAASFSWLVLSHVFNHLLGGNHTIANFFFYLKRIFFFTPMGPVCDSWDFDPAGQYIFTIVHMTGSRLGRRCEDPRMSRSKASWS